MSTTRSATGESMNLRESDGFVCGSCKTGDHESCQEIRLVDGKAQICTCSECNEWYEAAEDYAKKEVDREQA